MSNEHDHHNDVTPSRGFWRSPSGIACLFFLAAAGYFLFMEHRAHIVPYLPYVLLLLCPLMHLFHHGGHGHHHHDDSKEG